MTGAETRSAVAHLVRRVAFGAPPEEIDRLAALGYEGAVNRLLDLRSADPAADAVPAPTYDAAGHAADLKDEDPEIRKQARATANAERRALPLWWLQRMAAADRPVREKLTFLWHDHFATSIEKVKVAELMYRHRQTLYDLGPGRFDELVGAVARDPAMLIWLDGRDNQAGAPNENFARELMELFTLGHGDGHGGPDGTQPYTEQDVAEAGRALTGWTTNRRGRVAFDPSRHDPGVKTVLGTTGALGLDEVVAATTRHPACAPHVVSCLFSGIARPAGPDDPVVQELAGPFATDLDVTALLRRMLLHPDFVAPATRSALVRTPVDLVIGLARAFGIRPDASFVQALLRLGQVPFVPPDVAGWPANEAWLSTASALVRLQAASAFTRLVDTDGLVGTSAVQRPASLARLLGIDGWGMATTTALRAATTAADALTIAIVAPEHLVA
jgi:uncharacterized protein (DUF1800 family)